MLLQLLKSKIHRATITAKNLTYAGSISIDSALMEAAGLLLNEKVLVCNLSNGLRFVTCAMEGEANSGKIELNGASARLGEVGDKIIIMSFGLFSEQEVSQFQPKVVLVDEHNKPAEYNF